MNRTVLARLVSATSIRVLISLVLALLLWGWVTVQRDPSVSRTFADLPLAAASLPEPLIVVGRLPDVTVQVTGPRSLVDDVTAADLDLRLDLDDVDQPGEYALPVEVDTPNAVRASRVTPPRVQILVDERIAREFPLEVLPPELDDNARQIGEIDLETTRVTVTGPRSVVDQVREVVLPIAIGERVADFSAEFAPVARNAAGTAITGVEIQPPTVRADVRVTARGRSLAVLIQTAGEAAEGFEVVDRRVNPPAVLVDGPPEVLDQIVSLQTEPVDIQGATDTVSRRVGLEGLPAGARVIEPASGAVDVLIQIQRRGVVQPLPDQQITITGIGTGLDAVAEPTVVDVVLIASDEALAMLEPGDISVRVDARNLGPGTHRLRPSVSVPPGVTWLRTEPLQVDVTITALDVATPRASPAATAAPPAATPDRPPIP